LTPSPPPLPASFYFLLVYSLLRLEKCPFKRSFYLFLENILRMGWREENNKPECACVFIYAFKGYTSLNNAWKIVIDFTFTFTDYY